MPYDRYVISPHGSKWLLRWNGRALTTFRDQAQALHAAMVAARMSRGRGNVTTVLTEQDRDAPPVHSVRYSHQPSTA
jgi:hypothetical protein